MAFRRKDASPAPIQNPRPAQTGGIQAKTLA